MRCPITIALLGLTFCPAVAVPQARPVDPFPFPLKWDDTTAGVATDVSFLNDAPAGRHGHVTARDGHFVEADTGRRVRFFGVNLGADEAFPEKADADRFARRLAKAGVNVVRLHHLDNTWAIQSGGSLWDRTRQDRQHFDPAQLEKVDYLVARLKENGIYVNINLKMSKELTAADGMPESIKDVGTLHQKRIDYFQRRMVDLQKDYARRLLTHVNPHTKLSYVDDPAVAFVEINNENSLLGFWTRDLGRGLDRLPEPFKSELADRWTAWLKRKYDTDAKLTAAWSLGATEPGPSVVTADHRWTLEQQGGSRAAMRQRDAAMQQQGTDRGAPPAQVDVTNTSGTDWHVQAHIPGLTLTEGATYTLAFRARADAKRSITVNVTKDAADWNNMGLSQAVQVGPEWTSHSLVFSAKETAPAHARIAFILGGATGGVSIAGVELMPGAAGSGLQPGESVASCIAIPVSATRAQWGDWLTFLSDVERGYADEMLDFLRDDLKVRANVVVTQIDYGGLAGLHRERRTDFADAHTYWQHPSFAGSAWDPANWAIENSPQVNAMRADRFGALGEIAMTRVAGKPYTLSEYDHPAPSDYVAEMLPTLATFAAVQDWDAIYTFAAGDYSAKAKPNRILGFFDQNNHPAKWSFYPTAALIFRSGLVEPAGASATVELPAPLWAPSQFVDQAWRSVLNAEPVGFLTRRLAISDRPLARGAAPRLVESGRAGSPARLVKTPHGQAYVVSAPAVVTFVGYVGDADLPAGEADLKTAPFGNNFAAVTAVATDGRPLSSSARVLVTVCGRVQNQAMGWNAARTSVGTAWGKGPTVAEHVPAALTIPVDGPRNAYVLDSTGRRAGAADVSIEGGRLTLTARPQDQTLLYEIARE